MTTLVPSSDAMVSQAYPTKNYGGVASLQVNAAPNERRGFVLFPQPFPLGVTIIEAELELRQRGAATGGTRTITARLLSGPFIESTLKWQGQPAETGPATSRPLGNSAEDGRAWVLDVKALMQMVSDGTPWYGFRITSNNATAISFYGREEGDEDLVPVLRVVWSDAPSAPTNLAPAGGRSISVLRPTLRFDFNDIVGNTDLSGIDVQVSTSTSFASPVAGSGELDATLPQWTVDVDLPGSTYYWRARTRDGAGLWSPYSEIATFKRTAKVEPALTNPPAEPDNIVYTPTPTFSWVAAGQVAFQLFITPAGDSTRVLWDSTKRASTDTSLTLPSDQELLLAPGGDYEVHLRVWDSVARESIPEENAYGETSRTFTYGASSTVPPVTDLVVLPADSASPFREVECVREGELDALVITVDGVPVAVVDADDALMSDDTYRFEVRGLVPRRDSVIGVAAQYNDVTSAVATVSAITAPKGMWLYSLAAGGPAIQIRGEDPDSSVEASEESAVFRPPNARNPMVITQAVRGPEGKVDDRSAWIRSDAVEAWDALVLLRSEDLGLTRVDLTSRVRIFNTYRRHKRDLVDQVPIGFEYLEMRR